MNWYTYYSLVLKDSLGRSQVVVLVKNSAAEGEDIKRLGFNP